LKIYTHNAGARTSRWLDDSMHRVPAVGFNSIANLLPEPVTSQWATERTKDATLKRITVTVKSLLEAQFMGFYFFCITFITQ